MLRPALDQVGDNFFRKKLGPEVACDVMNFALAKVWNGTLERHGSIAGGPARCDFRWKPDAAKLGR